MALNFNDPIWMGLGAIMQRENTEAELLAGYGLSEFDLGAIGWLAYQHGDINLDGSTN